MPRRTKAKPRTTINKSLDNLIKSFNEEKKNEQLKENVNSNASKKRELQFSINDTKTKIYTKKRSNKNEDVDQILMSKGDSQSEISTKGKKKKICKKTPLDITVEETSNTNKTKSNYDSSSYSKYNAAAPAFKKILEDHKKLKDHKDKLKFLESINQKIVEQYSNVKYSNEVDQFTGEIFDCKHLSIEDLETIIEKYIPKLKTILKGKTSSEYYQRFHKSNTIRDLNNCTPLIVFSQNQVQYMLETITSTLDPMDRQTSYIFRVLLPELCLLIFMETHQMNKWSALKYLNERPIF